MTTSDSTFVVAGSFASPAAALAALKDSTQPDWDLVLMDLQLPGIDGVEAPPRGRQQASVRAEADRARVPARGFR